MTPWTVAARMLCPWYFPGERTGVGCHFLLQVVLTLFNLSKLKNMKSFHVKAFTNTGQVTMKMGHKLLFQVMN